MFAKRVDDRIRVVTDDDDDVVDRRGGERADDARQEGVAAVERQRRLGTAHAARLPGGQDDGGNHASHRSRIAGT